MSGQKKEAGNTPAPAAPNNTTANGRTSIIDLFALTKQELDALSIAAVWRLPNGERLLRERLIREAEADEAQALWLAEARPDMAEFYLQIAESYHADAEEERAELRWMERQDRSEAWCAENYRWNREVFAALTRSRPERFARYARMAQASA